MSSRRSIRRPLVALLVGGLVGGGLMAVTPAGAEVSNAVATSWKKVWKKELKPLADQRYYTKKNSDTRYQPKGSYETAGSGYTKVETDTKYQPKGSYALTGSSYTKGESDGKYLPRPAVIRGALGIGGQSTGVNDYFSGSISFGVQFASAPQAHYIRLGAAVPAGCSGTPQAPDAQPGHLCVFESYAGGPIGTNRDTCAASVPVCFGKADPWGAAVFMYASGAGQVESYLSWAARPPAAGLAAGSRETTLAQPPAGVTESPSTR